MIFVPVVDVDNTPLMPCHPARARELIRKGKAVKKYRLGIYYIQLKYKKIPNNQEVVVGIDPGSKKEAFTVMGAKHTFINIQTDAVTWVKDKIKKRRESRRTRRNRNTPCRANKLNRKKGGLSPSTRARWQLKMRILNILNGLYPITKVIVEDIKARTWKGSKKWNGSFSPLEVGKQWFYGWCQSKWELVTIQGFETAQLRQQLGLKKSSSKMSDKWDAHCVDSWTIANSVIGLSKPDNMRMLLLYPINFIRRQLHKLNPIKGGIRHEYGGTTGLIKKGAVVYHDNQLKIAGGCAAAGIELKDMKGKRINKCISFKKVKVVVPHNSFGWAYA